MAAISTFRSGTYTSKANLEAIAQLINTCREADGLESRTSAARLRENFADPQFDPAQDLRLWQDGDGELVAVAKLWRSPPETEAIGELDFDIHPRVRHSGLDTDILTWAEHRLREAATADLPLSLHSGCRDSEEERRSLLKLWGFVPERYFHRLKRSLSEPLPVPQSPAGWTVRSVESKDAEAWVTMFNQTFIDHWNHHPMTVEEFHYYSTLSDYDPSLDLVLETPDGELVAFCASEIDAERNTRLGLKEGHVCLLGTRRGYRRMGLARTLLLANLRKLQAVGMDVATIGVDAQNPLGAVGLYQAVGFEHVRSSTVFRRSVERSPLG